MFEFTFALLPIGALAGTAGYFLLVRQVWALPDRKAQLKRIFFSTKSEVAFGTGPPLGVLLIGLGALCGAIGCFGLLIWVFLNKR